MTDNAFDIDPRNGTITVSKTSRLDRETVDVYTLIIKVESFDYTNRIRKNNEEAGLN